VLCHFAPAFTVFLGIDSSSCHAAPSARERPVPEEVEIETRDLQDTIEDLHQERGERDAEARKAAWTRYIAMATAFLAVVAAVAALQSGTLVNEAMIQQLKASDGWNEYQAARQKGHLYTLAATALLDAGAAAAGRRAAGMVSGGLTSAGGSARSPVHTASAAEGAARSAGLVREADRRRARRAGGEADRRTPPPDWTRLPAGLRLAEYVGQVEKEAGKQEGLREQAEEYQRKSEHDMHTHHRFAESVAFFQVAIGLSAVAALTGMKPVWWLSLLVGAAGLASFVAGASR
jgi:hypothetical protein